MAGNGEIWVGSASGVSRFDGRTWRAYTIEDGIPRDWIDCVAIDPDGEVWVGMNWSLHSFDGTRWKTYESAHNDGYLMEPVRSIVIDDAGAKWFGGNSGISRFDGTSWTVWRLTNTVTEIPLSAEIDPDGMPWFGTTSGIFRYDGKTWHSDDYGVTIGILYESIRSVAVGPDGMKWVATDGGVSRFDGLSWKGFTTKNGLASNDVFCIKPESGGRVWCGSRNGSVSMFDGQSWKTYTTADGLPKSTVRGIAIDSRGVKWFATGNGVARYDGQSWKTYTTSDGLASNSVYSIQVDGAGTVWCGGDEGVSSFDGHVWTTYTTKDGLINNRIGYMVIDSGGVKWFGTDYGLSRFDGQTWESFLVGEYIVGLTLDRNGRPWIQHSLRGNFVTRIDGESSRSYEIPDRSLYGRMACDPDGSLWMAGSSRFGKFVGHFLSPESFPSGIQEPSPISFNLRQNYPNPFNPSTTISFTLPRSGQTRVSIYNSQGQKIRTLADGTLAAGAHTLVWDGKDAAGKASASGIYFSELVSPVGVERKKMLLVR